MTTARPWAVVLSVLATLVGAGLLVGGKAATAATCW